MTTDADLGIFLSKIDVPNGVYGCWIWSTSIRDGYGRFRAVSAHRWSYERAVGPVPDGLQLDHLCRVRNCVNPFHVEPVTNRENTLRGESFAAVNARKTHCPQGHPYDEANTYVGPTGFRYCRECRRARKKSTAARGTARATA